MVKTKQSHFALVLPGAVARGAYEAGVIDVLTEQEIHIDRIIATSSGALNGLAYAVGISQGREKEMAKNLVQTWVEFGGWENSLSLNPLNLLKGRGLSNNKGLLNIMRALIKPAPCSKERDVEFRVIVTPINGAVSNIGSKPATSYEQLIEFTGRDFESAKRLERVFNVVSAASAFPGLFAPVEVEGLGACVDGGAVNNAPIRYALEESDVNRVIMPVPFPPLMKAGDWKSGMNLMNHLAAILINERMFRDLKNAQNINRKVDLLNGLLKKGVINAAQLEKIKSVMEIRNVEITEIRPQQDLKISPFSGFFHKKDRLQLIEAGRQAARETLAQIPSLNPKGVQTT